MRLLNTNKIQVEEAYPDRLPPYAILSHTWDGDEMSFSDLESLTGYWETGTGANSQKLPPNKKKSFDKIRRAVRTARQQGFKYIWIDTCCIDRTNNADVTEAVNNSFLWYQNAAVCYAHLSDVESAEMEEVIADKSTLRRSRWFTRGWTLSELIAPEKMEFYARDWSHLGSKKHDKFVKLLSKGSGVPLNVLKGEMKLEDVCIATKMQWAAMRETTRPEDVAYSLLGMFEVKMSINYGEGSNAFIRLQQELLHKTHDHTLFAWYADEDGGPGTSSPSTELKLWGLLADSPKRFSYSGRLKPMATQSKGAEAPWTMTAKGLRAAFVIRPCSEFGFSTDVYQARLSCEPQDLSTSPPTIFLKRLWGDQFARILAEKRSLGTSTPKHTEGTLETIFVKQQPTQSVRHIRITVADQPPPAGIVDRTPIKWEVMAAYPTEYWDKKATLKTPGFQTGIVGVLRIQVNIPRAVYLVDVAVGMVHDQRSCRSWCQQYKVPDEKWTPEDTYDRIDELLDSGEIVVTNTSSQDHDGTYLPATFVSSDRNGYRSLEVMVRISRSWYGSVKPGLRPILKKLTKLQPTVEDGPAHHSDDEQLHPGMRSRSMTESIIQPIKVESEKTLSSRNGGDENHAATRPLNIKRNTDPGRSLNGSSPATPSSLSAVGSKIGIYEKNAKADQARLSGDFSRHHGNHEGSDSQDADAEREETDDDDEDDDDDDGDDDDDAYDCAIDSDLDISDGNHSSTGRDPSDLQGRATRLFEKLRDLQDSCRNLMMLGTRGRTLERAPIATPVAGSLVGVLQNRSSSTLGARPSLDAIRSGRQSEDGEWHGVCPVHFSGCSCKRAFSLGRRGSSASGRASVSRGPLPKR